MVVVEVRGQTYHMDNSLQLKWDKLKNGELAKYDEDRFYIVDGAEGSGKSLFTLQQASYIDETILDDEGKKVLPRICFTAKEFLEAIQNNRSTPEQTRVIVFDEAFRGLSSKSAVSKNNKMLVEALMEARQNNLLVFIVSPSFYLIEFYAAVLRSQALFHVIKERNTRKRYVRVFGKRDKAILYQIGIRKGWGYPRRTKQRVRFYNKYPGGDKFEKKYRKKKRDSLRVKDETVAPTHKWKLQRDVTIKLLHESGKTLHQIQEELAKHKIDISFGQIGAIIRGANKGNEEN